MALKYINIFQSETAKIFPKLGFFGLKTNHLATLVVASCLYDYLHICIYKNMFSFHRKLLILKSILKIAQVRDVAVSRRQGFKINFLKMAQ
jgi:hypothetical protein